MERWSGLFRRGAVSTVTVETGKTSFPLCSLVEAYQTYTSAKTHLNLKEGGMKQYHFSLLGVLQLSNHLQIFYQKRLMYIPSSSLDSLILPLRQLCIMEELPLVKQRDFMWGFRISPLVVNLPQAWRLWLFQPVQTWMKYHANGHRIRLFECFQGWGCGVVRWDSLEVWGSKFSNG